MDEFDAFWPSWPAGVKGSTLVLVHLRCRVDRLFDIIFGHSSDFQERFRRSRGFSAFSETAWVPNAAELPCLPGGFSWRRPPLAAGSSPPLEQLKGRLQKVCFQSTRSLKTEELRRCLDAQSGTRIVVESCVCVSAPYGDCFRTICRFTLSATGAGADGSAPTSQLRVDYAMAYSRPLNRFARALVEPAAESGLTKHFAQFLTDLRAFVEFSDALPVGGLNNVAAPAEPASGSASPRAPAPLVDPAGARRRMRGVAHSFVDDHLLDLCLPAAEILLASVGAAASRDAWLRRTAAAISAGLVLAILQVLLVAWHSLGRACARHAPQWALARACERAHLGLGLPTSATGFVAAVVLIMILRSVLDDWAAHKVARGPAPAAEHVTVADGGADPVQSPTPPAASALGDATTVEALPSIHIQRLQLIGGFFIGRPLGQRRAMRDLQGGAPKPEAAVRDDRVAASSAGSRHSSGAALTSVPPPARSASPPAHGALPPPDSGAPTAPSPSLPRAAPAGEQQQLWPAAGVVVEVVYENERRQPFRGWGHTWPGHFLPTDPVRHWCDAQGAAPNGGRTFEECAAQLPAGWTWCADWAIDLSGVGAAARGAGQGGWFYAFSFVTLPFSGPACCHHANMMSCVRRRRWIRTRVPSDWAAHMPRAQLVQCFAPAWNRAFAPVTAEPVAPAVVDAAAEVAVDAAADGVTRGLLASTSCADGKCRSGLATAAPTDASALSMQHSGASLGAAVARSPGTAVRPSTLADSLQVVDVASCSSSACGHPVARMVPASSPDLARASLCLECRSHSTPQDADVELAADDAGDMPSRWPGVQPPRGVSDLPSSPRVVAGGSPPWRDRPRDTMSPDSHDQELHGQASSDQSRGGPGDRDLPGDADNSPMPTQERSGADVCSQDVVVAQHQAPAELPAEAPSALGELPFAFLRSPEAAWAAATAALPTVCRSDALARSVEDLAGDDGQVANVVSNLMRMYSERFYGARRSRSTASAEPE